MATATATRLHSSTNRSAQQAQAAADPPEIRRLSALSRQLEQHGEWAALLAMADMYLKGAYPRYLPNRPLACTLLQHAAMCPQGSVAGEAQVRFVQARTETVQSVDQAGVPLPTQFAQHALAWAKRESALASAFERPVVPVQHVKQRQRQRQTQEAAAAPEAPASTEVALLRSDPQNVHDHSVVQIVKGNLRRLRAQKDVTAGLDEDEDALLDSADAASAVDDVRHCILSQAQLDLSPDERSDALDVLDSLTTSAHSTFGMSEVDALGAVWARIQAVDDAQRRADLSTLLAKQLASGMEHGHVVCSTGKVTRMLGTFDGVDEPDLQQARPTWAIKEELAALAASVRGRHPEGAEDAMRAEFAHLAQQTYVVELGMDPLVLGKLVEQFLEGF